MTIVTILTVGGIYFLPTFVAWGRKNHPAAIFILNLFLGWTVVAWVIALAMAFWSNNAKAPATRAGA